MSFDFRPEHESLLLDFEQARNNLQIGCLEDFLTANILSGPLELLAELVIIDFEIRYRQSGKVAMQDYLDQYPQLLESRSIRDELIREEIGLRKQHRDLPDAMELRSRFPGDAAVLQILSEVAEKPEVEAGESVPLFPPGTMVHCYRIEKCIGRGAFALVYSAEEVKLKRRVALKFLPHPSGLQADLRTRMLREAQTQAMLQHPNIIPVYHVGQHEGFDYISTRLVDGLTIEQLLNQTGDKSAAGANPFDIIESVKIISCLAAALEHAHSMGIVHRDIKPSNIMIENEQPLLLDFGLARVTDSSQQLTHEGDVVGTPAFMPPEQADGRAWQADPRSDVYGLGAVLYRMVCGRLPFRGSAAQVVYQVLKSEPVKPRQINSKIAKDLQTIILKCLEKEPSRRYQTANQFQVDLELFVQGRPIRAKPVGMPTKWVKWARRKPVMATLFASLLVLLVFLGGAATQIDRVTQQRDRAQTLEKETEGLLAQSAADSAKLAMQRGRIQHAIENFELALSRGYPDKNELRLQMVEAFFIRRDMQSARRILQTIEKDTVFASAQGAVPLWKMELAEEQHRDELRVDSLLHDALSRKLTTANRNYVSSLLAPSTPDAILLLNNSLRDHPFHFRSRRMLVMLLLASARFDEAAVQVEIARQHFPESQDFLLLDSLCLAGNANWQAGKQMIDESSLSLEDRLKWTRLCRFVFELRNDLDLNDGSGDLDLAKLIQRVDEFNDHFAPLIRQRQWRLPVKVSGHFSRFTNVLNSLSPADTLTQANELSRLVESHPEGSLFILLGNLRIGNVSLNQKDKTANIEALSQARQAYQMALDSPGFLKNSDQFAWKGVYVTSVSLALVYQHEAARNVNEFSTAARQVNPSMITKPNAVRAFAVASLNIEDLAQARKWIDRWKQLPPGDVASQIDVLWHEAILFKKSEDWIPLQTNCLEILKLDPNHVESVKLLGTAKAKIREFADR